MIKILASNFKTKMADDEEVFSDEEMLLLVLLLCLCLRYCGLHGRRNDANISASTRKRDDFLFLCLRLCLRSCLSPFGLHVGFLCLCLRHTYKPALRQQLCFNIPRPKTYVGAGLWNRLDNQMRKMGSLVQF